MTFKSSVITAGTLFSFLLMENALAVGGAALPSSVLPEQVSRSISSQQPVAETAVAAPIVEKPKDETSALAEQAKKIKFQLNGVVVEGNRMYTARDLKKIYGPFVGKTITVADLFGIVQAITNYYRNNGYILSRAILPPQRVKNGIVRIRVIEGYISKVEVSGKPYNSRCLVLGFGRRIKECRPLELSRMEKYLLLANEIPGTQVKAVLAPSKSDVGGADLTLVTSTSPLTAYFSYDNYGTRYIGPQQMTGNLSANSIVAAGDAAQITLTKTPKGTQLTYLDLNYNTPLDDYGTRWLIGDTRVKTHPLFILEPVDIRGINDNYYTTVYFPLVRTRTKSLTMRIGFNYLDTNVTTLGFKLYTDHIRSLDFGGTYNFSDSYRGTNLISADFRKGLPIWGYTSNTNPETAETSRPGGHANYSKIMATFSRLQNIKGNFSAYGLVQGQWVPNSMLAAEQYSFGGPQLGRGYDVAEILGDRGAGGTVELRYDWSVANWWMQLVEFYAFYDIGAVWNYELIGGVPLKQSMTSTGFGARLYFAKYISGNVFWAQPLTRRVATEELIGQGKNPRVYFSLVASFS